MEVRTVRPWSFSRDQACSSFEYSLVLFSHFPEIKKDNVIHFIKSTFSYFPEQNNSYSCFPEYEIADSYFPDFYTLYFLFSRIHHFCNLMKWIIIFPKLDFLFSRIGNPRNWNSKNSDKKIIREYERAPFDCVLAACYITCYVN